MSERRALHKYAVLLALIGIGHNTFGASHTPRSAAVLSVQVPATEDDVLAAVEAVAKDPVVHGTYSFDKDRTLTGAKLADRSSYFGTWDGGGKAFYKVADGILSPIGFKDSSDMGTITVRYVVQPVDANNTTVSIDAVFVESAHRAVHPSEGGVESAEYGGIREQLDKISAERQKARQEIQRATKERADATLVRATTAERPRVAAANSSEVHELEQQVASLRHMVQTHVLGSNTPLKAAPYKSAATLASLPSHTDVVVLILTRYWYGVETSDGHRGWVHRNQVEVLP